MKKLTKFEQNSDCKSIHKDGICRWPTLEGRLKNGFGTELEALRQLSSMNPLSEYGKKRLKKLEKIEKTLEEDKQLNKTRENIKKAVDAAPKSVLFEDAKKQVDNSYKNK